jgi:histidine ammonia-lyase
MLQLMEGSQIADQFKPQTQDPYAFRCIPQVHGASKEAFWHVEYMFETEINSVTDNPNVFPDDDLILSGGNFHGQPLAISLDYLAIALAELGNISERRTYNLLTGNRDLPEFLVAAPGLNSGLMIPQYTAASMVSENKQLCTPASVDSITSSNGQEDHVSMGANGAVKTYRVVQNLRYILAIEWLNAAQAVQYRKPLHTSPYLEKLLKQYRTTVPFIENDRYLHNDIVNTVKFLDNIYPQIIQPIA